MNKYFIIVLLFTGISLISCMDTADADKKAEVAVNKDTPEYKAYNVVQNMKSVRQMEAVAKQKGQSVSLKVNSTYTNGKDGFFWFQVVVNIGKTQLPKMNVKVFENSYEVTIRDDKTGENLTEEAYLKKYPIQ